MLNQFCSVCNSKMHSKIQSWHWECSTCGYEKSTFTPEINGNHAHEQVNEDLREKGLKSIRIENFNTLIRLIKESNKGDNRLLDVGCAHGWFIEIAQKQGFQAVGIEPDLNMYNLTTKRNLPVKNGFFPDVLSTTESFSVIVFNDVFEHIPDVKHILNACLSHTTPEGQLVLNLPSSDGIFYKTSKILAKIGFVSFFERLWQKGLPSPHLHYFNTKNLSKLLESNGYKVVSKGHLPTLRLKGLYARISFAKNHSLPMKLFIYLALISIFPILSLLPSDIIYTISKKK